MENKLEAITIECAINASPESVWALWTNPDHIIRWNSASDDWHTTKASNDLRVGGKFTSRMEAKDGSMGFDFYGVYDTVVAEEKLEYTLGDGRKVKVLFSSVDGGTQVIETFDPETENPVEMQRGGWQAILDNFKKYAEAQ